MVAAPTAYLALLAGLCVERLFELFLSRRNAARLFKKGAIELGRGHYRLMAVFHMLFIASCAAEATMLPRPVPRVVSVAALLGVLGAQALRYWVVTTLGERWNTRLIVVPGEAPISSGPFRFIRHPNYLAVAVEMVCVPAVAGAWITVTLFSLGNAAILAGRIAAEESALGSEYAHRFASLPRFLPRFRRRSPIGGAS